MAHLVRSVATAIIIIFYLGGLFRVNCIVCIVHVKLYYSLRAFDGETRSCFSACLAADVTDAAWQKAQLSLSFGGLGLCSFALHSSSAFLASFSASGVGNTNNLYLQQSLIIFNSQVSNSDSVTIESVLADQPRQRSLSQKLDGHLFETLLMSSSTANKARLYQLWPPMPVLGSRLLPLSG